MGDTLREEYKTTQRSYNQLHRATRRYTRVPMKSTVRGEQSNSTRRMKMNLLEFFEDKEKTKMDVTITPNLTYDEWKVLTSTNKKGHFKHLTTGKIRKQKYQKIAYEKHITSLQSKIETEEFIKEILKDKSLPMKQCKDCKKWYPAIQEYNGQTVSFWVTNKNMKDGLRSFCGKWGTIHKYESYGETVLSLGCDAERDRQSKITKDNPKGIKRGDQGDHSERMKHKDKILRRLVSDAKKNDRIKGLVCDLPDDWAIKKEEEQNGCCKRAGILFDYTHMTRQEGSNIFKPSINRLDNTKPHTDDNCELILRFLNLGFGNAPKHLVDRVCSELLIKKAT